MTSPPLDNTHDRQRHAWHDITTLGQHTRSNDVGRGMTSLPLESTHGQMTSDVAFHHRPRTAHTVERRQAWHDITALGLHAFLDDVGRGMTSPPLDSKHGWTASGVACHHSPWTSNVVERRRAWHDITALGLDAWSNDVRRGMISPPLDNIHDR